MADGDTELPQNPMVSVYRYLCEKFIKSGYIPNTTMARANFHLPYGSDDTEVILEDYYQHVHTPLIVKSPMTIKYQRSLSSSQETREKIRTIVSKCLNTLHGLITEEHGYIELDLVQTVILGANRMIIANSNAESGKNLSVSEVEKLTHPDVSHLQASQLRMSLPSGEQKLLDIFQDLGAIIKERRDKSGKVVCECFSRGFIYKEKSFGGALNLCRDDLSFTSWCVCRSLPEVHVLLNPGPESEDNVHSIGGDVRLKSLVRIKRKKCDLIDSLTRNAPSELTTENVGGLLQHVKSGNGFQVQPNCGIVAITETYNRVVYVVSMDDLEFLLVVCDGFKYHIDRYSGKSVMNYKFSRWPKIKFPIPSVDSHAETKYIEMITVIVQAFIDAIAEGRLVPEVWQTFARSSSGPVSSVVLQEVRRRIANAERLEEALNLPPNSSHDVLSEKVNNLLNDVKSGDVLLPKFLIEKLIGLAKSRGIKTIL